MLSSSSIGAKSKSKEVQFKVKEKIGQGSFGEVEKCEHIQTGAIYAVKTIGVNWMYAQKIRQQASNMMISRSDYILELVDHFFDQSLNSIVLVTPYYKHGSLQNRIKEKWTFDQLICFMYQISKALFDMFKEKICHLDIKPQNILLKSEDQYVVCDLGCSRRLDANSNLMMSVHNMCISTNARGGGTTQYGSPDLVLNQEMNQYSDIWSLGIILYKIIYGKHPMQLISKMNIEQKLEKFSKGAFTIKYPESPDFEPISAIVKRMLVCANNRKERISWDQILQKIYEIAKIPDNQRGHIITNFDLFLDYIDNICILVSALLHFLDELEEQFTGIENQIKNIMKHLCIYMVTITKEISSQTKGPRQEGWQFYLFDVTRKNLTLKQIQFAKSLQKQSKKLCENRKINIEYESFSLSSKKTINLCLKLSKLLSRLPEPQKITQKIHKKRAQSISDFISMRNKLQFSESKSLKEFVTTLINS